MSRGERSILYVMAGVLIVLGIFSLWVILHQQSYDGQILHGKTSEHITQEEVSIKTAQEYKKVTVENYRYPDSDGSEEAQTAKNAESSNAKSTEYIIPDSDSRKITKADLSTLSKDELVKARNEIFARHGRKFSDADLQAYFDSKDWYIAEYEPDEFDEMTKKLTSALERRNAAFILKYEKKKGYL